MPTLARITLYPCKGLDGQPVESARILPSGALEHDRRFALLDTQGRFFNGKRTSRVQELRSAMDLEHQRWELTQHDEVATFSLVEDREEIEQYFSLWLHERVTLAEDRTHGHPDDTAAPGPTVVSTATLSTVGSWFDLPLDEVRRRFRPNLEIEGVEPFWEDRLFGDPGEEVPFKVGSVRLAGVNPCQRCVVPSRDSQSGVADPAFTKAFAERRRETLPDWAPRSRFDHYYRLAVNTRLAGTAGGAITVGDRVELL